MPAPWIEVLNFPIPLPGLSVPAISLAMATVSLALGVFVIWDDRRKVSKLAKQIKLLASELEKLAKPLTQDMLDALHVLFHREGTAVELTDCWEGFKDSLIRDTVENGSEVYIKTVPAESHFTAKHIFGNLSALMPALPGLATALGLLGTFCALLCGLAELHVADAGSVDGIGPFINALSGKFFSSISGLLTALAATLYLSTWRKAHLDRNLHGLTHRLNALIPSRAPEFILLELKKELTRLDRTVGHLATDMAQKLPEVIQETLGGDMQSVLNAINNLGHATEALKEVNSTQLRETLVAVSAIRDGVDKLQNQNSDAITESIRGLMDEFKQGFHQSASTEMQQLTENLGQAAQFLQGMEARGQQEAERQQASDERLSNLIRAMEAASQNQQEKVSANTEQMNALLQQVVEQASQLNQQGQQSLQEQLQQLMAQTQEQGQVWQRQLQELVGQTLGQFQHESQQQVEQLARQSGEMAHRLDSLLSRLDETGQKQQEQTQQALSSMQAQLEGSAQAYGQQIQAQQQAVNTAVEEALSRLASFMETRESGLEKAYQHLETSQQALAHTLSVGSQDLGQSVHGLKEAISLSRQNMDQLNQSQLTLKGAIENLQTAQQSMMTGLRDASATAATYQQAIGAMQSLHDRQSRVYGELESRLASILGNINTNLEQYTNRTNQGLSQNLKEWDNELKEASRVFSGAIFEVRESAESLTEAMGDLAQRLPQASQAKADAVLSSRY